MKHLIKSREFILTLFILVMVTLITLINPAFFDPKNLMDIMRNVSYTTIAALGMSMVMITGGIDVSMGAVLSALALSCGAMAVGGLPQPVYLLLTVLLGAAVGCVNGFFIVKTKVPPMICTLAVSSIVSGTIIVITNGKWVIGLPESFNLIGKGSIGGLPISVLIMTAVLAWNIWFMSRSRLGRNIYAVGGNPGAARLSGVNVDRTLILTYMISGILLAIATIVYCTRLASIVTDCGTNFHIPLIAAATIGGTSILGGSGRPVGTFLGALILELFRTALVYLKISTYWEQAVQGGLILFAVLLGAISIINSKKAVGADAK